MRSLERGFTSGSQRIMKFGIGDVEQITRSPKREEYVPGQKSDPFLSTLEARGHLRWMIQKDLLKQDMLFMGGTSLVIRSAF